MVRLKWATFPLELLEEVKKTLTEYFGQTSSEFVETYKDAYKFYLLQLDTPDRIRKGAGVARKLEDVKRRKAFDLSVLTLDARQAVEQRLNPLIDRVVLETGAPSLDLPSTNLYRNTIRFDISGDVRIKACGGSFSFVI